MDPLSLSLEESRGYKKWNEVYYTIEGFSNFYQ